MGIGFATPAELPNLYITYNDLYYNGQLVTRGGCVLGNMKLNLVTTVEGILFSQKHYIALIDTTGVQSVWFSSTDSSQVVQATKAKLKKMRDVMLTSQAL